MKNLISSILVVSLASAVPEASGAASGGFLQNQGQIDERVRFYGSAPRAAIYFADEAVVLDVKTGATSEASPHGSDPSSAAAPGRQGSSVWLRFENADRAMAVEGRQRLPGETHFFLGNDPDAWSTHVPTFAEVLYRNLWPGIDLVFRVDAERLEYEAVLQPGADPSLIAFRYEGAERVIRESETSWRIEVPGRTLANVRETATRGAIILAPERGSRLPATESTTTTEWCTYLGGSDLDNGIAIVLDDASRPVVAGGTKSPDFPATPGAYQDSLANPNYDAFVAKLDASGSSLVWCTYLGGAATGGFDFAGAVAIDAMGSTVIAGNTHSADFPVTSGCFDSTKAGTSLSSDIFVTKLDSTGSSLVWSTFLGAGKSDDLWDLKLDVLGNVVLAGGTESGAFPTTEGAFDTTKTPFSFAGFVTKMNSSGNALVWSTFVEGPQNDWVRSLELDSFENALICGETKSSDFPVTTGAYDESHNGGTDAFAAALSAGGDSLLWGTFLGTPGEELATSIAPGSAGNVIVAGDTDDATFATTEDAYDRTHNGGHDLFVAALTPTGADLVWSTFLGGSGDDLWPVLVLDAENCPVFGYTTDSDDLPMAWATALAPVDATHNGGQDPAIARLSPDGGSLVWNSYFGGSGEEHLNSNCLALDADGFSVVASGWTGSEDIATTPGAYNETLNGIEDVLIYKVRPPAATAAPEGSVASGLFRLHDARPNPFVHSTSIRYDLPGATHVDVSVYDVSGRLVRQLADGRRSGGVHRIVWDGQDTAGAAVAAGVYFCRLEAGAAEQSRKVIVRR